jgi:hypothetical protein
VLRRFPSVIGRREAEKDDRPQAEHDLDLAEEVQDLRCDAWHRRVPFASCPFIVPLLYAARQAGHWRGHEGVKDRQEEDACRHRIERIDGDARGKRREQPVRRRCRIGRERNRK